MADIGGMIVSKFCQSCGKELQDNFNACPVCGAMVGGNPSVDNSQVGGQQVNNPTIVNNYQSGPTPVLTERNIVLAIVLSFVTCGIYALYWFVVMTDDANKVSGENNPSGGMALLFGILTCGIYYFYWYYKMGQKLANAGKMHGKDINDNSILYLVLGIFGLGIVNYCIIQSDLNKFANK